MQLGFALRLGLADALPDAARKAVVARLLDDCDSEIDRFERTIQDSQVDVPALQADRAFVEALSRPQPRRQAMHAEQD